MATGEAEPLAVAPRPCSTCPYRRDTPPGVWHPDEYAKLERYDREGLEAPLGVFMCHQTKATGVPTACRGWMTVAGDSLAVRVAVACGQVTADQRDAAPLVPLYATGAEACAAGLAGVEDPSPAARAAMARLVASGAGKVLPADRTCHGPAPADMVRPDEVGDSVTKGPHMAAKRATGGRRGMIRAGGGGGKRRGTSAAGSKRARGRGAGVAGQTATATRGRKRRSDVKGAGERFGAKLTLKMSPRGREELEHQAAAAGFQTKGNQKGTSRYLRWLAEQDRGRLKMGDFAYNPEAGNGDAAD